MMSKAKRFGLVLVVLTTIPMVSYAYTWRIPLEHPTIAGAVDSASYGDTVLVAPGTYCRERYLDTDHGSVWILMRDGITLMSEAGPEVTVLVESGARIFNTTVFCDSVSNGTVKGFTLRGGICGLNGAMQSYNTGIKMSSCHMLVEDNIVRAMMEGIVIFGDSPHIGTPVVRGNEIYVCHEGIGVGFVSPTRSPRIEGNVIYECNYGIWARNCSPYIVSNTITHNDIAGVHFEGYSTSLMERNVITYNAEYGVEAIMDYIYDSPCLNCSWVPESANDVYGNGWYEVYYEEQTGLGLFEATYNYWGTLCPDPSRFFGNVSISIWVDSTHMW